VAQVQRVRKKEHLDCHPGKELGENKVWRHPLAYDATCVVASGSRFSASTYRGKELEKNENRPTCHAQFQTVAVVISICAAMEIVGKPFLQLVACSVIFEVNHEPAQERMQCYSPASP
jgi:hypothetical protein